MPLFGHAGRARLLADRIICLSMKDRYLNHHTACADARPTTPAKRDAPPLNPISSGATTPRKFSH